MHYANQTRLLFYLITVLVCLIFSAGLIGMFAIWRLGKSRSLNTGISIPKWVALALKAGFIETQILEYSFIAWLSHMMIFWGFVSLLVLTSFHFILNWLLPHTWSFSLYFYSGTGNLFLALWGDFWGIIMLMGILIALLRRYWLRPKTLETVYDDSIAILLLFMVTLSGFACEATRLAVRPESNDSAFSFAVNWIVPYLKPFLLTEFHISFLFWIHAAISFAFLVYIPFGKLRHIFASPMDFAFVTAGSRYSKGK